MKRIALFLGAVFPLLIWAGSPQGFPVESSTLVGTTPVTALASNKDRGYLIIQNNSSGQCQVKFASAVSGTEGLILGSGQNYEVNAAFLKSPVYMRCATAASSIVFLESNY